MKKRKRTPTLLLKENILYAPHLIQQKLLKEKYYETCNQNAAKVQECKHSLYGYTTATTVAVTKLK